MAKKIHRWTRNPRSDEQIIQNPIPSRGRGYTAKSGSPLFSPIAVSRDSYSYAVIPDRYKGLNESSSVPPRRPTYTPGATGSQLTGTAGKKSTPSRPTLKPTPPSFATLAEQIFSMKSFSKRPTTPSFTHSRVPLSGLAKRLTTTVIVGRDPKPISLGNRSAFNLDRGPKGDMFNASPPPSLPLPDKSGSYALGLAKFINKRQKTWKDRNPGSGTRFLQDISAALNPHWSNEYPTNKSLKREYDQNIKSILGVMSGKRY